MNSDDDLVATVARRMTDGDPSPFLRTRVIARLDEPARRQPLWRAPAVAAVATVIVVTVVAFMARQQAADVHDAPVRATNAAPPVAPPSVVQSVASNPAASGLVAETRLSRRTTLRRVRTSAPPKIAFESEPHPIPALGGVQPLTVDTIQPQPLAIPLLVIAPLPQPVMNAGSESGKF